MIKQSWREHVLPLANEFARRNDGAVAILFGLMVIVLILFSGLAVDSSRVLHTSMRIQRALDTSAIAAARQLDVEDISASQISSTASKYFNEQLLDQISQSVSLSNFKAETDFETGRVTVSVDVTIPLYFAAFANSSPNKDKAMSASATYKPRKLEVALVVDVTGSMCNNPPGSSSPPCTSGAKIDALKIAAKDMVDNLHHSNPEYGTVRLSLVPYAASINVGPALAFAATDGASIDGCVVERKGQKAYKNDPPKPGWYFETSSKAQHGSYYCPVNAVVPLSDMSDTLSRNLFKSSIDALQGKSGTAGHLGTAWGWYTLSPEWSAHFPLLQPRDYDPDKITKAVVLMTDGMFNTAYNNGGENHSWPNTTDPTKVGTSGYQTLQLCNNMRNPSNSDEAIKIFTIAFQAPTEAQDLLKQCSGVENFYNANSSSELTKAFNKIAEELSKLRVSS